MDLLCAGTKAELKSMFDEGKIIQFADFYPVGHGSSNYKKWFSSEGTEPYPITYKTGYEPYVLVNRRTVPWYDERFRGYGWDKVCPHCPLFYISRTRNGCISQPWLHADSLQA